MFPEISASINPRYFCAFSAGIIASPGDSIAGTTSPAPFGPGTETTPDAYFLGALAPRPTAIGVPAKAICFAIALS